MNYALIVNNVAIDVSTSPTTDFHPDLAAQFVVVPDNVQAGWVDTDGTWAAPTPPTPSIPVTVYPVLPPMLFYLCFTPMERIFIKLLASSGGIPAFSPLLGGNGTSGGNATAIPQDAFITEFWATFQLALEVNSTVDMNLKSIQDGLAYFASPTAPTPVVLGVGTSTAPATRVAQILAGVPQ